MASKKKKTETPKDPLFEPDVSATAKQLFDLLNEKGYANIAAVGFVKAAMSWEEKGSDMHSKWKEVLKILENK